ncbi:MAG TPA: MFS transporter, partial [Micromonosporaceae bacterium]
GSGRTIGFLVVSVAAGVWFVWRCLHHRSPLMELHLLRVPRFGVANAGVSLFSAAFAIMLLSNVLWCQEVWGWTALRTGLGMAPGPALVPIVTILSARAMRRLGPGPLVAAGSVLFAAAMLWRVVFVSVTPDYVRDLLPSMLLGGAGVGLALGTLIAAGVTSLPMHRSATGSALVNSNRQIFSALGVALLVTLLGSTVGAGSLSEFRGAWAIAAALALVCTGAGLVLMAQRRTAAPTPASTELAPV